MSLLRIRRTRHVAMLVRAALVAAVAALPAAAQVRAERPAGALFEQVVAVLEDRETGAGVRRGELPALAARYRAAARLSEPAEERAVVHAMLAELGVSHLALLSEHSYRAVMAELAGELQPTLGCGIAVTAGQAYVTAVLEGGPAERAGLTNGDRVLALDGVPVLESPRLDWRSDDAALPGPALHGVRVRAGDVVQWTVAARPGEVRLVPVAAARYSALRAAEESVAAIDLGDVRMGYVHLWYMHDRGLSALLRRALRGALARCDVLVLDLRGRGGSAAAVFAVLKILERDGRPLLCLIDRGTRSAKEVLAYEVRRRGLGRLVGERTAGAVIPAYFTRVGDDAVLMYPGHALDEYTEALEGVGVRPDLIAPGRGPYSAGHDAILRAAVDLLIAEAATR